MDVEQFPVVSTPQHAPFPLDGDISPSQREIPKDGRVTSPCLICLLQVSDSTSKLIFLDSWKGLPFENAEQISSRFIRILIKDDQANLQKRVTCCHQLCVINVLFRFHHNNDYLIASFRESLFEAKLSTFSSTSPTSPTSRVSSDENTPWEHFSPVTLAEGPNVAKFMMFSNLDWDTYDTLDFEVRWCISIYISYCRD